MVASNNDSSRRAPLNLETRERMARDLTQNLDYLRRLAVEAESGRGPRIDRLNIPGERLFKRLWARLHRR